MSDPKENPVESDSIYRTPASETGFTPKGDLLAAYVGPKNAGYYEKHFARFKNQGGSVSWNWPAFFIASLWLLYRKMWLNAFFYWIVLPVMLSALATLVSLYAGPAASGVFYYSVYMLIALLLFPMYANRIYYRHAQNKVDKVASITSSAEQQSVELARIGGTSKIVLVVLPFIILMLLGILAAIAIPAYQDYTIRAQVAEGMNLGGSAKVAVEERFMSSGELAANNEIAGLAPANQIFGNYVSSVEVLDGEVLVTYGNHANAVISGKVLVFKPAQDPANMLSWSCSSPGIQSKHLPAVCR